MTDAHAIFILTPRWVATLKVSFQKARNRRAVGLL
jgi:hypothetical protein